MKLTRLKQLIAAIGLVIGLAGGAAVVTGAAVVVVRAGTGADPGDAFNPTALIPESLRGMVTWDADAPDLDRVMEPTTRRALEAAWLRAAAAHELESGSTVQAFDHELRVGFYSLDGQIVGVTATSLVARDVNGRTALMRESHDAVIMLTDGRWELDQLVRTEAELVTGADDPTS